MTFKPDPTKQTQEVIFFLKIKKPTNYLSKTKLLIAPTLKDFKGSWNFSG